MKKNVSMISAIAVVALLHSAVNNLSIAQNPIVKENANTGTRDWVLTKVRADTCRLEKPYKAAYFCRQQDIEGYCSKASILAGQTLEVFVSTNPQSDFTVDIYRMGFYGGAGGRKMLSLGPFKGKKQNTPSDGDKNLRDCNWEKKF